MYVCKCCMYVCNVVVYVNCGCMCIVYVCKYTIQYLQHPIYCVLYNVVPTMSCKRWAVLKTIDYMIYAAYFCNEYKNSSMVKELCHPYCW